MSYLGKRSRRPAPIVLALMLSATVQMSGATAIGQETADPALCLIAPLTTSDLTIYASATPAGDRSLTEEVLTGSPVDATTGAEVADLIAMSIACANANDPLRAFALFTPAYLNERFSGENQDELGHLVAALTRKPAVAVDSDRLSLVSVDDVRLLADGRIAATVVTENASIRFVDTVVLAKTDPGWRIDQVVLGPATPIGTPEAGSALQSTTKTVG